VRSSSPPASASSGQGKAVAITRATAVSTRKL
jgi:hypothetical protein